MNFTTKIPIQKFDNPIDYSSKIVSLGSCFAENMGAKLQYFKFQSTSNPFGIIFNSISIETLISMTVNKMEFTEKDIFFHNEMWHCFEVHSIMSNASSDLLLNNLNITLHSFRNQLKEATHCIITYGTSWVYKNKDTNKIVANCHKVPQNQFEKEILSVEEIEKSIQKTIQLIKEINPNCNIIFTISPVRHLKDGFVENQRSKAHLITAIQSIINSKLPILNYFPSFEIQMDELRDYRFYAEDMLHPNQIAIDYIWERFCECIIFEESLNIMDEVATIQKGLSHRPFNPNSESHDKFITNLNKKIKILNKQFPQIRF